MSDTGHTGVPGQPGGKPGPDDRPTGSLHGEPTTAGLPGRAPLSGAAGPQIGDGVGGTIGPYHILSIVGEGGFGVVYKAERREPMVQRVALKVIKPGMDSRAVIARFEQERQALAVMDHPSVARVFDGGLTGPEWVGGPGRPYFVMEYVDGEPITDYCDRHAFTIAQRLELFTHVCEAVQHAHAKGIIHRDLKPSNVLVETVEGRPLVKVIDFGISKAVDRTAHAGSVFTSEGLLIGTPEYMSPEQATGQTDIDTRTDVYSLGVMLYELLTGLLPFDPRSLRSAGYAEIQRIIREVDPPHPSRRLSTLGDSATDIAQRRRTQARSLGRQLRSELEWIPLRALRKERDRRYTTPQELADDIRNYLAGRPLTAGPESRAYRARKFVRRNRALVAALTVVALALVSAAAVSTAFWRREAVARREAAQERDLAQTVNAFLNDDLLLAGDPERDGPDVKVAELLDRAAAALPARFQDRPAVEARLRRTLGEAYLAAGRPAQAQAQLEQARAIFQTTPPVRAEDRTLVDLSLGEAMWRHGDSESAVPILESAIARRTAEAGPDDLLAINARNRLAGAYKRAGRLDEAEAIYTDVLARRTRLLGPTHVDTLIARYNLALVAVARAPARIDGPQADQARAALQSALGQMQAIAGETRAALGAQDPQTLAVEAEVAALLGRAGRCDDARAAYDALAPAMLARFGPAHWRTVETLAKHGRLLARCGHPAEAITPLREALVGYRTLYGPDHPDTRTVATWLAEAEKAAASPPP